MTDSPVPRCLTIAGSDSGGGAGIQADLKAFAAAGCYGTTAIVALTAQNTVGVTDVLEVPPEFVRAQLDAVFSDIGVDAAKTGMLFSAAVIETVADFLADHPVPLVVDPVMVASSGARLLRDDAVEALVDAALPAGDGGHSEPSGGPGAHCSDRLEPVTALGARPRSRGAGRDRHRRTRRPTRSTTSSTAASTSRSRSSTMTSPPPTGPAAPIRPRSLRPWPGDCPWRRPPVRPLPPRAGRSSRGWTRSAPATGPSTCWGSVRLGDVGELGLLAELERRGLAVGIENDAAAAAGRMRRHPGRPGRGRPLPPRLDLVARPRLSGSGGQPQRPGGVRRGARGLVVTLAAPSETAVADVVELYEGLGEAGVPVIGGDTTSADRARAERDGDRPLRPRTGQGGRTAGRRPRRDRAARRRRELPSEPSGTRGRRSASGGERARGHRARHARPLRRPRPRRRPHRRPLRLPPRHRPRAGPACGRRRARRPRLRRGLRAACRVPEAIAGFTEIGRCEEGEGVELLVGGAPVDLGGFEHFHPSRRD